MNRPAKNSSPEAQRATQPLRFDVLAAADPLGVFPSPASLLLSPTGEVLASGSPDEVDHHPAAAGARRTVRPHAVVIPGLVNAHTHLDLTHIGPRPHDPADGFVPWVNHIRTHRRDDPQTIAASVRQGIALSLAGGTVAVGDIAGSAKGRYFLAPWHTLHESPLHGVSYIECFGLGLNQPRTAVALGAFLDENESDLTAARSARVKIGLQPHAPNTVSPTHYRFIVQQALRRGLPLSTHLAESPEERQFIAEARGPQRMLLESLNLWDDSLLNDFGRGLQPVAHLSSILAEASFLAAHVNDCPDEALALLARTGTTVAYCPRSSAYFGAERHFGPHRYQAMLAAGIPVALGTDSIVNLPPQAADPSRGGISVLDEMRFLFARDGADPLLLLRMATLNGGAALDIDPACFTFRAGSTPLGVLAVDVPKGSDIPPNPLEMALRSHSCPEFLFRREYALGPP